MGRTQKIVIYDLHIDTNEFLGLHTSGKEGKQDSWFLFDSYNVNKCGDRY